MKKNGIRVVNWSLWRPAAALMRRLRFPGKMALIAVAFLLPMVWLLIGFWSGERESLAFVSNERQGVLFNQTAYRLLDATDQWSLAAQNQAPGGSATAVDQARQQFDPLFAQLQQQKTPLRDRWQLAPEWARVEQALDEARKLQTDDPQRAAASLGAVSHSVVELMASVTDRSGLALDPELPTYYLMSAALMRGPEVIRRTSALRGLADAALRAGQIEGAQHALLADLRSQTRVELARARMDLDKVIKAEPELAERLKLNAPQATEEFLAQLDALFPVGVTAVQGDRAALMEKANRTLEAQYAQVAGNLDVLDRMLAAREARLMRDLWITLGLTLASLLLAVFLAMGFYRAMFGGFKALRRHLMAISLGDLRSQIDGKGRDEISGLLREVGYMQLSLRQTVSQVQGASDSVVQASLEIATGTRDLSSRTEAAAAALEQSSAALEETSASVSHTAESARQASVIAGDNAQAAQRGGEVMQQVVHTMERIQASSRKINDIIGVIDGIAFQTNILALNAAVEAARAGDQGLGFAVVAGEVRSLAQRSAEAAKEIKALISSSVTDVDGGMHVVHDAGSAMEEIVRHADQVRRLLDEVADGTREQSLGMGQIGQAVQALDQNTQANAALVEETATAAASQRVAAVRMAAQVDEFRLPGEHVASTLVDGVDVDAFIDAHRQWKVKLRDAIENQEKVDTDKLSRDDCCALGQWIYGEGQRLGARSSFVDLVDRHRRFHQVAGSVGEHINRRQYRQAEDALAPGTPFSQATSDVVLVLAAAKRVGF